MRVSRPAIPLPPGVRRERRRVLIVGRPRAISQCTQRKRSESRPGTARKIEKKGQCTRGDGGQRLPSRIPSPKLDDTGGGPDKKPRGKRKNSEGQKESRQVRPFPQGGLLNVLSSSGALPFKNQGSDLEGKDEKIRAEYERTKAFSSNGRNPHRKTSGPHGSRVVKRREQGKKTEARGGPHVESRRLSAADTPVRRPVRLDPRARQSSKGT